MRKLICCFAVAAAACGTTQSNSGGVATAGASNVPAPPNVDLKRCDPAGKRVQQLDTNDDGKPDLWKMYSAVVSGGQTIDVLVCKEVDLNHDGKVDEVVYFDDAGNRVLEKFDLDFDGKIDETVYYEGGKRVRVEIDTDFDNKPDIWKFYENDKLVRVERDSNHDGRVDYWEYYEGGKLDRIGYDTSGSGKVDRWDRAPEDNEAPEAGTAPAAAQTPGGQGQKPTGQAAPGKTPETTPPAEPAKKK
jgi:antitoxin component YwqK of YwqJK toxin-antitoxin module